MIILCVMTLGLLFKHFMFVFDSVYVVCLCGVYAYECSYLLRSGDGADPPDPGVIAIFQLSAFSARN